MTVETHTTSTTWVCPPGVTSVQIEAYASGGPGGVDASRGGAGGAGAQYAICLSLTVVPGNSYTLTVGTAGGDSWMSDTGSAPVSVAHGALAKGGAAASTNTPGTGSSASGIGNTVNAGGSGMAGAAGTGGGGGGAGGPSGAGTTSTSSTGGAGGGGSAGAGGNGSGGSGNSFGGGGAGSPTSAGSGGPGAVILTYTGAIITTGFWEFF